MSYPSWLRRLSHTGNNFLVGWFFLDIIALEFYCFVLFRKPHPPTTPPEKALMLSQDTLVVPQKCLFMLSASKLCFCYSMQPYRNYDVCSFPLTQTPLCPAPLSFFLPLARPAVTTSRISPPESSLGKSLFKALSVLVFQKRIVLCICVAWAIEELVSRIGVPKQLKEFWVLVDSL